MSNAKKTKKQLIRELNELSEKISKLESPATETHHGREDFLRFSWLLEETSPSENFSKRPVETYEHTCRNLPALSTCRVILDAVGEDSLREIADDCLRLLETSMAIYELNGDYALDIITSGWCRFLNHTSRHLCGTDNNKETLGNGKWHCHESCWTNASKVSIETGKPVDIECRGGLRLYAVPILANRETVGSINLGYGDPPTDQQKLKEIATLYEVSEKELTEQAHAYSSRPPFIIDFAKQSLRSIAKMIGKIVECKQQEKQTNRLRSRLNAICNVNQLIAHQPDRDKLLHGVCHKLIESQGYYNVWIVLLDESQKTLATAEAGLGNDFLPLIEQFKSGEMPDCVQKALAQSDVISIAEPHGTCGRCPLATLYHGRAAMTIRLENEGKIYGVLSAAIPTDLATEAEDRMLFKELAQDISFALHGIETEERRAHAEKEKEKIKKQFYHVQKMETIGVLAGGVAHDFNNILAAIIGYTEMALADIPEGNSTADYLDQVLKAGNRAKELVKHILAFSCETRHESKQITIKPILKEAVKFLKTTLPKTIEVRSTIEECPDVMLADPVFIFQILMNLFTNAAHAMRKEGGELAIRLTGVSLDADTVLRYPNLQPGPYIRIAISDTGQGMDDEVGKHIVEPFFTTKGEDEGTGMGLSVVHEMVNDLGGTVKVISKPGEGTTFYLLFPTIDESKKSDIQVHMSLPRGSECILFVDDEDVLADIGLKMLKNFGYDVVAKTSSLEALKAFREQPGKFNLVITDQDMPHITGEKLSQEPVKIRPDIKIILCTGFSDENISENASSFGIQKVLMKPIVMCDLADAIRTVLDKK
ncbi:MAG: response regulator [Syntrophaceae bacterium]|nr:response regulator [Syntrophaceae bacterium]